MVGVRHNSHNITHLESVSFKAYVKSKYTYIYVKHKCVTWYNVVPKIIKLQ